MRDEAQIARHNEIVRYTYLLMKGELTGWERGFVKSCAKKSWELSQGKHPKMMEPLRTIVRKYFGGFK